MTVFVEIWWNAFIAFLKELVGAEAPVVAAWAKQFMTDEGKIILADAAQYGPLVYAGSMTIVEASGKLWDDLKAKGIVDIENLGELVYNALRTQTNAAANV